MFVTVVHYNAILTKKCMQYIVAYFFWLQFWCTWLSDHCIALLNTDHTMSQQVFVDMKQRVLEIIINFFMANGFVNHRLLVYSQRGFVKCFKIDWNIVIFDIIARSVFNRQQTTQSRWCNGSAFERIGLRAQVKYGLRTLLSIDKAYDHYWN